MSNVKLPCQNEKMHCDVWLHKLAKEGEAAPCDLDKSSTPCNFFVTIREKIIYIKMCVHKMIIYRYTNTQTCVSMLELCWWVL